ncbi:MAG TPA: hypothetical protein PK781_09555 [Terrimesophilobacter sp.]|nr:hypothetical protein [Terrimesophilobacter sp.]HRQ00692.1 hypothetical protein [Terrimesophilobacter sp.]
MGIEAGALADFVAVLDEHFTREHFRLAPARTLPAGVQRVYQRGSRLGDVLIGGSGLDTFTKRVGPLSVRGVVVVAAEPTGAGTARVTIALVGGFDLDTLVMRAVDESITGAGARGIHPVADEGWSAANTLPESSPAHPQTAHALGLH